MLLLSAAALAATLTEIPTFLRGDVVVDYTYDRLAGSLSEHQLLADDDFDVAQRQIQSHTLRYSAVIGVAPGAAVSVTIPHTLRKSVDVQEWSRMVYDPTTETGTYSGTASESDYTMGLGSGVQGVWIGAKGTPFSELFTRRGNRATWLLEGAVRTPNTERNWYSVVEPQENEGTVGMRGAGEGGVGLRIASVGSTTFGRAEPWIGVSWEDTLPFEMDLVDDTGATLVSGAEVDPGGHLQVRFGTELVAGANEASGARTAFDLHMVFDYTAASNLPTGVEIPAVLVPDAGVVQAAESLEGGAGLSLNLRFFTNLEFDLYGDALYRLPQRIEHPYPVYTGADTMHLVTGARLVVRIR